VRFADEPPRTRVASTSRTRLKAKASSVNIDPIFFTVSSFSRLSLSADLLAKKQKQLQPRRKA
jgi:hypothetical protein